MSTDLIQLNTIIVNSFFGGVKRGQCLQFTPLSENYAQLERDEVVLLRDALDAWLDEPSELAALRAETNHRFVVCTYCGWRLDYESEKREAARESANAHALECEKDPRNIENAALRARVGELERERDAVKETLAVALVALCKSHDSNDDGRDTVSDELASKHFATWEEIFTLETAALAKGAK